MPRLSFFTCVFLRRNRFLYYLSPASHSLLLQRVPGLSPAWVGIIHAPQNQRHWTVRGRLVSDLQGQTATSHKKSPSKRSLDGAPVFTFPPNQGFQRPASSRPAHPGG